MRQIRKGQPPPSLIRHQAARFATYDNYPEKDDLRASLVQEQRGLCCFCLTRIEPNGQSMKIAHWRPQTVQPQDQLSYHNLLGACRGGEGHPHDDQHCDTRQGNRELSRNPAEPNHHIEDLLSYRGDGTIWSTDAQFGFEIAELLNLNSKWLQNQRKAVLSGFFLELGKRSLSRTRLEDLLSRWHGDETVGPLPEYCMVVAFWLRKRLARA
ncbi:retron system putative HNH endonuclease [uncultured Paludibaculum sp.]|uniref:retron system putative HNH endonuclease n=1 Tax=uncultured Paludibaculum sp. TaxID=1765020 RepID=UPI002AAAEA7F|nr:retron system putative HNH endonuclease [uncultured Paludibaculum sp.]